MSSNWQQPQSAQGSKQAPFWHGYMNRPQTLQAYWISEKLEPPPSKQGQQQNIGPASQPVDASWPGDAAPQQHGVGHLAAHQDATAAVPDDSSSNASARKASAVAVSDRVDLSGALEDAAAASAGNTLTVSAHKSSTGDMSDVQSQSGAAGCSTIAATLPGLDHQQQQPQQQDQQLISPTASDASETELDVSSLEQHEDAELGIAADDSAAELHSQIASLAPASQLDSSRAADELGHHHAHLQSAALTDVLGSSRSEQSGSGNTLDHQYRHNTDFASQRVSPNDNSKQAPDSARAAIQDAEVAKSSAISGGQQPTPQHVDAARLQPYSGLVQAEAKHKPTPQHDDDAARLQPYSGLVQAEAGHKPDYSKRTGPSQAVGNSLTAQERYKPCACLLAICEGVLLTLHLQALCFTACHL